MLQSVGFRTPPPTLLILARQTTPSGNMVVWEVILTATPNRHRPLPLALGSDTGRQGAVREEQVWAADPEPCPSLAAARTPAGNQVLLPSPWKERLEAGIRPFSLGT